MKFLLLFLTLLASCQKENTLFNPAIKPSLNSYSESLNANSYSALGRDLMHQVFEKKLDEAVLDSYAIRKSPSDLDKKMAKVIVLSPDKDQIFYVPASSSNEWLEANLNFKRQSNSKLIWINKKLQIGKTSYLLITTTSDILLNEKKYQQQEMVFDKISDLELTQISKFQNIEIKIEKMEATPELIMEEGVEDMGKRCLVGDERPRAVTCRCKFTIPKYSSNFTSWTKSNDGTVNFRPSINNANLEEITANEWNMNFENQQSVNTLKINFRKNFDIVKVFIGNPIETNSCPDQIIKQQTAKGIFKYNVWVKIIGTSFTEENYGELVEEL